MSDQLIWHYLDRIDYFVGFFIAILKVNQLENSQLYHVHSCKKQKMKHQQWIWCDEEEKVVEW